MATITTAHVSYQISRVLILPAGAQNGTPGAIRVIASEINHNYAANLAWRADVMFTRSANGGWFFSSWNIGVHLDAAQPMAQAIEAGLADFINELDIDARNAELAAAPSTSAVAAPHAYRQVTIDRAIAQRIFVTDAMVSGSNTLREVALDFVASYTGVNSFIHDIAIRLADQGVLSVPQMRGALNVMLAEAKAARAKPPVAPAFTQAEYLSALDNARAQSDTRGDQPYIDIRSANDKLADAAGAPPAVDDQPPAERRTPNGTYTVILDRDADTYRTLRLADAPDHFNAAPGTQIASFLSGADNDGDYTGFAFVVGTSVRVWRKYTDRASYSEVTPIVKALNILVNSADPIAHMREYVLRSARCGVCGRKLTTPDSIRLGIGPICAGKLADQGYVFEMPKTARAILAAVKTIEEAQAAKAPALTREEKTEAAKRALEAVNELFD